MAGRSIGGKFNSIGTAQEQRDNAAMVVRMCGQIGVDGYATLSNDDKLFMDDIRFKIHNSASTNIMFGWRQVQKMVQVHKQVMEVRDAATKAK